MCDSSMSKSSIQDILKLVETLFQSWIWYNRYQESMSPTIVDAIKIGLAKILRFKNEPNNPVMTIPPMM